MNTNNIEQFLKDILDPEVFGFAVSAEVRDAARTLIGIPASETGETRKFEREERYMVIKLSRLAVQPWLRDGVLNKIKNVVPPSALVDAVVVESDWPEYEPTWAALEARITGNAA